MKIALAQINTTIGDFEGNSAKILEFANKTNAELTVFPELSICGYPPRDLVNDPHFVDKCQETLQELASKLPSHRYFIVGTPRRGKVQTFNELQVYNSAALIYGGRIQDYQDKTLLPNDDVFDEKRHFKSGKKQRLFKIHDKMIGVVVCEDGWNNHTFNVLNHKNDPYDIDPVTQIALMGADIIVNISASPFYVDKYKVRQQLLKCTYADVHVPLLWCNAVGGSDHLVFDGNSMIVSEGEIYEAKSFEEDIIQYDAATGLVHGLDTFQTHDPIDSIYHALVLGVRDYARKCGFTKAVIGLSGGIDSAVTAAIAVKALGKDNVTGITMPSALSSKGSVDDSAKLAKNLGIKFHEISIGSTVASVKLDMMDTLGKTMDGVAAENIQARIRGMLLMAYSNSNPGTLVLSTGNKSELSVGYATLYGDMCGGLAVISDVPKTKVYELAKHINSLHYNLMIPKNTITKPPSAELSENQLDSDSLPPYDVLDDILKSYIEDLKSPEEIAIDHPLDIVMKVVRLVDRSEFKRQQAAPGIKISPKAFGWGRRVPIARKLS